MVVEYRELHRLNLQVQSALLNGQSAEARKVVDKLLDMAHERRAYPISLGYDKVRELIVRNQPDDALALMRGIDERMAAVAKLDTFEQAVGAVIELCRFCVKAWPEFS